MQYYNPFVCKNGVVHSIDMVYFEYLSYLHPKDILSEIRMVHILYPDVSYKEHLGRAPHSKYDYYLDGVAIGGAYIDMGKYNNYDAMTKTFDLIDMFQIRVNPNKHMQEEWFIELLDRLLSHADSGWIRKYDYAVDIPFDSKYVKLFDTRKEPGLYKGTRYYGQAGRHGYLKVYDKQKDLKRQNIMLDKPLTRIEHTLFDGKSISLEKVYILDNEMLRNDFDKLIDTDRALVEMYLQLKALGVDYDLKLSRRKLAKLESYIHGEYSILDYGDILPKLLEHLKDRFKAVGEVFNNALVLPVDEDGFVDVHTLDDLPFD